MYDILIIEDQPAVREVISEVMRSLGIEIQITQAINIKEAETQLLEKGWALIITDLSLGDGSSLDLIAKMQAQQVSIAPVILISGFLSAKHLNQAKSLDIKYVLAKPFNPDVLLNCVRKVLEVENKTADGAPHKPTHDNRLLPEIFEMDRKLGLLYRMFDEIPKNRDVSSVCSSALGVAMDMVYAKGGYIALFERHSHKLIRIASQGLNADFSPNACPIDDTPFTPLLMDEEEFIEIFSKNGNKRTCWPSTPVTSFIGVPIYLQGIPMGVLCLTDCMGNKSIEGEAKHMLGLLIKKLDTLLDNRAVHAALASSMNETLIALVRSLEARDRYTKDHSSRVSKLSVLFAKALGLDDETIQLIKTGGLLHDIGKVGIADSVLLKPGRYTDHEYSIMKAHPAIGDSILKNMDTLVRERLMVRHHHERWDGKGYPDKIGSTEIPFEARIVCVADAIDAMTTHRVYRQAKPLSFCAEQLEFASGTQFDPQIVAVALEAIKQGTISTQAISNDYNEGVLPIQAVQQQLQQQVGANL